MQDRIEDCKTTSQRWNLHAERLNRGLTVIEFAGACDVPLWVIRSALRGNRPSPRNALKIATFLGAQVTDIWPIEETA